jgi:hypothetical protein
MDTIEKFYVYKETVKDNKLNGKTPYRLLEYSKSFLKVKAM